MGAAGHPGAIVLFGSGENADVGREALRWLRASGRRPRHVAVLETPAGFEPNAEDVAARWGRFLAQQAESEGAAFTQIAARARGTPHSPDAPDVVRPLLGADLFVLGAGSPTYAARQLRGSLAWEHVRAGHVLGASLFLASAAAIAAGTRALPVYEIYKVGEDLHWTDGLALLELYGLRLAVVTHWDNTDGGAGLDTSRCFMGEERFARLRALLPADVSVLGIAEHTALALEPARGEADVLGRGCVTLLRDGNARTWETGDRLALRELGAFALPRADAVPSDVRGRIEAARSADEARRPPREVDEIVAARAKARAARDWQTADRLRAEIEERGWTVEDTASGTRLLARR
ncbi:MAG: cysteinyl-tRNA synthetase [Chloroflexota bacterium]|nr:cysteinyl-tRNA synthetase [Chloroflexota bacterium]MDE3100667.1 cysteinyl-tRNA synthetase [Chloroflexota bacterium]